MVILQEICMDAFEQFINKLKEVKSITLLKENVKRFIKYEQNYGCTISSFTSNGDCNAVYKEYLYLISIGFEEQVTKEQDWLEYIKKSLPF